MDKETSEKCSVVTRSYRVLLSQVTFITIVTSTFHFLYAELNLLSVIFVKKKQKKTDGNQIIELVNVIGPISLARNMTPHRTLDRTSNPINLFRNSHYNNITYTLVTRWELILLLDQSSET